MPKYLKQLKSEIEEQKKLSFYLLPSFWLTLILLTAIMVVPFNIWINLQEENLRDEFYLDTKNKLKAKIQTTNSIFTNFHNLLYGISRLPEITDSILQDRPIDSNTTDYLKVLLKTYKNFDSLSVIQADGTNTLLIYKELNSIFEARQNIAASDSLNEWESLRTLRPNHILISPFQFEKKFNSDGLLIAYYVASVPIFQENIMIGAIQLKVNILLDYLKVVANINPRLEPLNLDIYNGDWLVNQLDPSKSLMSGREPTGNNVKLDMPALWHDINTQKSGIHESPEGIFVFETDIPFASSRSSEWRYSPTMYSKFHFTFVNFIPRENFKSAITQWLYWIFIVSFIAIAIIVANILITRKMNSHAIAIKNQQLDHLLTLNDAIIDNLGAALITINQLGIITRFSTQAEKLFGYSSDEVEGSNIKILMRGDIAAMHDEFLNNYVKDAVAGVPASQTILGRTRLLIAKSKSGEEFPVEIVVTRVPFADSHRFVGLITDIRKRLDLESSLHEALAQAQNANEAKGQFLAHMSHEIRTPLSAIYGTLQLLRKKLATSEHSNLIEKATYSCKSLIVIINDILDLSKIEAGKVDLEEIPLSVCRITEEAINDVEAVAEIKGIVIELHGADNFEDGWLGDPTRIKQILINILSNAVKFTERGKIVITIENITNNVVQIIIEDSGIGMTPEQLDRLTTPFEQADKSITRLYGGTGLGMSICAKLISLMHGQLTVTSVINQGSTFSIQLPLKPTHENVVLDLQYAKDIDLTGRKILLVEDNLVNQTVFQAMMNDTNATLAIASNGQEALDILHTFDPEMIFMDIQMPKLDGIETCKKIKADNPLIPIVALTANVEPKDIKHYMSVGFDNHMGKPFEISHLLSLLEKYLST